MKFFEIRIEFWRFASVLRTVYFKWNCNFIYQKNSIPSIFKKIHEIRYNCKIINYMISQIYIIKYYLVAGICIRRLYVGHIKITYRVILSYL